MKKHVLEPLINTYLNGKDLTRDTRDVYHTILKQYVSYLKQHQITYASEEDVISYLQHKKKQPVSSKWLQHQITVIKGFYQFLNRLTIQDKTYEIYNKNITKNIKNVVPKPLKPKRVMVVKDARALLNCMKENRKSIISFRDYALIFLMLSTGLRSIEIRRARIRDLKHIGKKHVLYIQGKGHDSSDAFVHIPPHVYQAVKDYIQMRKDKRPFLFISHGRGGNHPNVSRAFIYLILQRNIKCCNLKIPHVHPHMLRHTASHLHLKAGGTIEETRRLLRHQKIETTLIYTNDIHSNQSNISNVLETYILKGDSK